MPIQRSFQPGENAAEKAPPKEKGRLENGGPSVQLLETEECMSSVLTDGRHHRSLSVGVKSARAGELA